MIKMRIILLLIVSLMSTICYSQITTNGVVLGKTPTDSSVMKFVEGAATGYIYFKNDTLWSKAKDTIRCLSCRITIGGHALADDTAVLCATAGTWYKVLGRWSDGNSNNLTTNNQNTLTFTGFTNTRIVGNGDSDFKADKNSVITYGMYVNGMLNTRMMTPVDCAAGKATSAHISRSVTLTRGDYFEVYIKSDVDNTTVDITSLMLTISGDR